MVSTVFTHTLIHVSAGNSNETDHYRRVKSQGRLGTQKLTMVIFLLAHSQSHKFV